MHSFKKLYNLIDFTKDIDRASFNSFCLQLQNKLSETLPGHTAHVKMASRIRLDELKFNSDRSTARISSVLILLYLNENKIFTSFILRPEYDGVHVMRKFGLYCYYEDLVKECLLNKYLCKKGCCDRKFKLSDKFLNIYKEGKL